MKKESTQVSAGVADDYTEKIKARRAKELTAEGHDPLKSRPIKTVRTVMVEAIVDLQKTLRNEDH